MFSNRNGFYKEVHHFLHQMIYAVMTAVMISFCETVNLLEGQLYYAILTMLSGPALPPDGVIRSPGQKPKTGRPWDA